MYVKLNLKKLSPLPTEAGECSSSGSRRPGHPHSTPWSCEKGKRKLTMHIMQDSTFCPRQYLHAPLICRGALCRDFHQPGKHPPFTQVLGCEGGWATRMAPGATTAKILDKITGRLNSRQAVRSNPFMSKEAPNGGKSRYQIMVHQQYALAARFTSRTLLVLFWLLYHDAINLSTPTECLCTTALPPPCAPHLSRRACRL